MTGTKPPQLRPRYRAGLQTDRLAAQPWVGLGGLLLATAGFFALALGIGSTTTSLLILGSISTFALPAVAVIAFWWNDWPGARLARPWTGLTDTVVAALALNRALAAYADSVHWTRATPDDWITTAAHNPGP